MERKKEGGGCSAKVKIRGMMGRYSLEGQRCGVLIAEMMDGYSLEGLRCGVLMGRLRCGVHMEKRESDEKFAF